MVMTLLAVLISVVMHARLSGNCGVMGGSNVKWTLSEDATVLTISGRGQMQNYYGLHGEETPWFQYRATIQTINIEEGVTSIGSSTFSMFDDESSLADITIPNSVTDIGERAFAHLNGPGLKEFTIPDGVTTLGNYVFYRCGMENLHLGNGLQTIGYGVFDESKLKSITIPAGLSEMDWSLFLQCPDLQAIMVAEDNAAYKSVDGVVFTKDGTEILFYPDGKPDTSYEIPEGVTKLGEVMFPLRMTTISIPASLTDVGNYALLGWTWEAFNVAADNPIYKSIDGVLFSKDGKTLIKFPSGKPDTFYTIPEGVTDIGKNAFGDNSNLTSIVIPEGVTSVGDYAISLCHKLESVTIPASLTSIGSGAFSECEAMKEFSVADDNPNYKSVDGALFTKDGKELMYYPVGNDRTEYVIPDGVTTIDGFAFRTAYNLTSVTLPEGLTFIGNAAFSFCVALTSINIPASVTTIRRNAFNYCIALTDVYCFADAAVLEWTDENCDDFIFEWGGKPVEQKTQCHVFDKAAFDAKWSTGDKTTDVNVEFVGDLKPANDETALNYSFDEETHTATVTEGTEPYEGDIVIPATVNHNGQDYAVTSIGRRAFNACSGLTNIEIPDSVTSIGSGAFYGCYSLTSLVIPDGVTSIGDEVFSDCYGLTSIGIPSDVTSIGDFAFSGCTGLTSIIIPNGVTSIGHAAFQYCSGLTSIEIPDGMTSISNYLFYKCSGLTSMEIPSSVTSIGNSAFEDCTALTNIKIPSSVTSMGKYVFRGCSGLTGIEIPDGVTSISRQLFYGCSGLTSIEIPSGVTSIGDEAFSHCPGLTSIVVADGNTVYDSRDNCNAIIRTQDNTLFQGCKNTIIPGSVTSISGLAFSGSDLTSITIPSCVTSISGDAFQGCPGLADVYCHADPATLSWGISPFDFMRDKATKFHVEDISAWSSFSDANVTFVGDLEPDAIESVAATDTSDGAWYTLSGTRLGGKPTLRGMYIKDGKKVYVK